MSEFSVVSDPVRNSIFAILIKSENIVDVIPFSKRAESWANSQFDDSFQIPDGMQATEFKTLTPEKKSIVSMMRSSCCNSESPSNFYDPKLFNRKHIFSSRKNIPINSGSSSTSPLRKFNKKSKLSIVDFKAKMFSKKISDDKNSKLFFSKNKRTERRVKSLIQNHPNRELSDLERIFISKSDKTRRFRF